MNRLGYMIIRTNKNGKNGYLILRQINLVSSGTWVIFMHHTMLICTLSIV